MKVSTKEERIWVNHKGVSLRKVITMVFRPRGEIREPHGKLQT